MRGRRRTMRYGMLSGLIAGAIALCLALPLPVLAEPLPEGTAQPRIVTQTGHPGRISAAAWTPDGKYLATGSSDGQVLLWDLSGHLVARTLLGGRGYRTVIDSIIPAPDSGGAIVSEIELRDIFENGVGSQVYRRTYTLRFGDERSEPGPAERIEFPWREDLGFLAGSLAFKASLTGHRDWPASSRGWKLALVRGEFRMLPPDPTAPAVALGSALGRDDDRGEARLEARARKIEELASLIDTIPELQAGNERNCGPDDTVACALRSPIPDVAGMRAEIDADQDQRGKRPQFSPDGRFLAWIADSTQDGSRLQLLDLRRSEMRSLDAEAGASFGWPASGALVLRSAQSYRSIDPESAAPRPLATAICLPIAADELLQPTPSPGYCLDGDGARDARHAVTLRFAQGRIEVRDAASGSPVCDAFIRESEIIPAAIALASADRRWMILRSAGGTFAVFALSDAYLRARTSGGRPGECPSPAAIASDAIGAGFHPTLPLLWVEGRLGEIAFHRTDRTGPRVADGGLGPPLFTLYRLAGGRFFAIDPDGRYDTNLPPDTSAVRWTVSDAPLQSLAPQTFMRDFYQPGLMRRLLECVGAGSGDCTGKFPPIPPLASLNRVLPKVRIVGIEWSNKHPSSLHRSLLPEVKPHYAVVSVEVEDGSDPQAPNGKTKTGVYDLRLFRNGRLVMHHPEQVFAEQQDRIDRYRGSTGGEIIAQSMSTEIEPEAVADKMRTDIAFWRRYSQVHRDPARGYPRFEFHVPMPTAPGTEDSVFSVYAFNEDRVKSETMEMPYRRPPVPPRKPRAYVVSVGIDAYDEPRLKLAFAARDAELIASRLSDIPGYEVRRIILTGRRRPDGKVSRVTRTDFELLFSSMARYDIPIAIQALADGGHDASQLAHIQPDDLLILSFSGHGWADPHGNFYLLPSDARWPEGADAPDRATLISSESLAVILGSLPAGQIALIIDACHSAASVDSQNFKPGPMGDPGLGQLAFDKGIRILAATQADDVALEDPGLRQGLLTHALAGEGITAEGGLADANRDGAITLEEWLGYAAKRMPSLSRDIRVKRATGDTGTLRGWVRAGPQKPPQVQEPSLFDFNAAPSGVVLKRVRR